MKVSVILPSYNVIKYIRQCLDSLLAQTIEDIEIICVDAYSTDGTLETIYEYAMRDRRVRLVYSDVKSYGRQVNIGIKLANGEYIGIVETDDYVEPDMYSFLYSIARNKKAQVVKSEYYLNYERQNGKEIEEVRRYIPRYIGEGEVISSKTSSNLHRWDSYIWNGIYSKKMIDDNGIELNESAGAAYQDIGFQHQVLACADSVCYTRGNWYHYRIARSGCSSLDSKCLFFLWDECKSLIDRKIIPETHLAAFYNRLVRAFFREYKKTFLFFSDYSEWLSYYIAPLRWFNQLLNSILEYDIYSQNVFSDDWKTITEKHLNDFENRSKTFIEKAKRLRTWLEEYDYLRKNDNPIAIIGCGKHVDALRDFLLRNGFNLIAMIDNDEKKWGSRYGKYLVTSPSEIIGTKDLFYFIASIRGSDAIKRQLINANVSPDLFSSVADYEFDVLGDMGLFPEFV